MVDCFLEASCFHAIFFSHLFWSPGPGQNAPPLIILALLTSWPWVSVVKLGERSRKVAGRGTPSRAQKGDSRLTLGNELSKETHLLRK